MKCWKKLFTFIGIVVAALAALAVLVPYKVERDEEKTDLTALLWRSRRSKKLGTSILFGVGITDEELEESLQPDDAEPEEAPAEVTETAAAEAPVEAAPAEEEKGEETV